MSFAQLRKEMVDLELVDTKAKVTFRCMLGKIKTVITEASAKRTYVRMIAGINMKKAQAEQEEIATVEVGYTTKTGAVKRARQEPRAEWEAPKKGEEGNKSTAQSPPKKQNQGEKRQAPTAFEMELEKEA